jgi:polyhydroxybutyrate depolymerase
MKLRTRLILFSILIGASIGVSWGTDADVHFAANAAASLAPGDYQRNVTVDGATRSYLVHIPPNYDRTKPTPLVIAFHGAFMNAAMMPRFTGLNRKADSAGFVVAYPNGTGFSGVALFFNASAPPSPDGPPDDVKFTSMLMDDLESAVNIDPKRIFVTGMSNGGMLCHRVAAELSDRIAAAAPVSGTLALPAIHPSRPVPIIMFHGLADRIVPFDGPRAAQVPTIRFRSVGETLSAWISADGCANEPTVIDFPDIAHDGTKVTRKTWGNGKGASEVVLIEIAGGGHTWPGIKPPARFIGKTTYNISADDLMWDFFQRHPLP